MQTLDVISINIWQMLVSLANLALLFWGVKKFLYKPVKKMLKARQDAIDVQYSKAENAKNEALSEKQAYEEKLSGAKAEADGIIQSAVNLAKMRENEILEKAKNDADIIVRQAKEDAELEKERRIQETLIGIKNKFGKNAILKGLNLQEGATAKDRNEQIGGHKA